jgi:hypothetical protein
MSMLLHSIDHASLGIEEIRKKKLFLFGFKVSNLSLVIFIGEKNAI